MVHVTVSEPKPPGAGAVAHTSYLVTTHLTTHLHPHADADEDNGDNAAVYHRYSEFQWLYERLHKERRGAIIPILEGSRFTRHRLALGENADGIVDERCAYLNIFLRDVASNPELIGAPSLEVFLAKGTGEAFEAAKRDIEGDGSGGGGDGGGEHAVDEDAHGGDGCAPGDAEGDASAGKAGAATTSSKSKGGKGSAIRQYVSKTVAKTATAVSAMGGKTKLYETKDEAKIKRAEHYVKELEAQVGCMAEQASKLVQWDQCEAGAWRSFGESADSWAAALREQQSGQKHDDEEVVSLTVSPSDDSDVADTTAAAADGLSAKLGTISAITGEAAAEMEKLAEGESASFKKSLDDVVQLVAAIKVALHKRSNGQLMCTSRFQHAAKVSVQSNASAEDLAKAKRAAEDAREELERATQRFLREMDRVSGDMDRRLSRAVGEYGRIQLERSGRMREVWSEMADLEGDGVGGGEAEGRGPPPGPSLASQEDSTLPEPSAPPLE